MEPQTKCPSSNAEYNPDSDPEWHWYNADTTQVILDFLLAEQLSLKTGMAVPESHQPLPQAITTVQEVQEGSIVKPIHQKRRLAAACARRKVMANSRTDSESRCRCGGKNAPTTTNPRIWVGTWLY